MLKKYLLNLIRSKSNIATLNQLATVGVLFRITTCYDDSRPLVTKVQRFINKYSLKGVGNSYSLSPAAKSIDDILLSGEGIHILEVEDIYLVSIVNSDKATSMGGEPNVRVDIYGLSKHLIQTRRILSMLYADTMGYPTISKHDGRRSEVVGRISPVYAKQTQYIDQQAYLEACSVVERMLAGREWYDERLLPYKEAVLLYGPPRTGKSNLVRHIASKYGIDIVICSPTSMPDVLRGTGPVILLIEDIDSHAFLCITEEEAEIDKAKEVGKQLTTYAAMNQQKQFSANYSEFINYLDGVVPLDNVILFISSNYMEKLKPSVIGKGRINRRIAVNHLPQDEIMVHLGDSDIYHPIRDKEDFKLGWINVAMMAELVNATTLSEVNEIINRN